MSKHRQLEVNAFYHYADEYRKRAVDELDIEKTDLTDMFIPELLRIAKDGGIINININAPPTMGKSITAFALAMIISKKLYKREIGIKDIDRDQHEYSVTLRNPDIKNTIRVVDEWNELETTGENATTEQALYNYFSDVMAQRFIHRISCSPRARPDGNSDIFLEVVENNRRTKTNSCKVRYRTYVGGVEYQQLLGFVTIDVSEILKRPWYQTYRKRKFEKMELITREGIFRPRELESAELIMTIVRKTKQLTKYTNMLTTGMIRNYVEMQVSEMKIPLSIPGTLFAIERVKGILESYSAYWKINRDIEKTERLINKMTTDGSERRDRIRAIKTIEQQIEIRTAIAEAISIQMSRLQRLKEINDKYNKKEGDDV